MLLYFLFIRMQRHSNTCKQARIPPRYSFLSLQFSFAFSFLNSSINWQYSNIYIYTLIEYYEIASFHRYNTNIIAFISFPSTWLSHVIPHSLYYIRVLNTTPVIKFPTEHFHNPPPPFVNKKIGVFTRNLTISPSQPTA